VVTASSNAAFGLLDRATCTWSNPGIADAIMKGILEGTSGIALNPKNTACAGGPAPTVTHVGMLNLQGKKMSGVFIRNTSSGPMWQASPGMYVSKAASADGYSAQQLNRKR
jgi:hypothetical protein